MGTDAAPPTDPIRAEAPTAHAGAYPWIVRIAAGLTLVIAGLALLRWFPGAGTLARGEPVGLAMMPLTAVGHLLGGTALALLAWTPPGRLRRLAARVCAAGAVVVGALVLAEYASGVDLGIDLLLFRDAVLAAGGRRPGRPAVNAGVGFVLAGLALLCLSRRGGYDAAAAQLLALAGFMVALLSVVGHVYGVEELYTLGSYMPMSLAAAVAFQTLALGILFARPAEGVTAVATADDFGGYVARRLIPAALLIPFLLGWVRLVGERAGWFGPIYGLTLVIVTAMVTFLALGCWLAAAIRRLDAQRREGEAARARLAAIVESSEDAINAVDLDGIVTDWNRSSERIYGYTREEAIGRSISMVAPPDRADELADILDRLRRGERIEHFDTVRMRKDGRPVDISLTVSPLRDAKGRVVGSSAIVRDITGKKRAQAERERLLERERAARREADRARAEADRSRLQAERRAREEAALREAAEAVTATFTVDQVIRRIAESALEATDADGAFVQRIEPGARETEVVAAAGRHTPPLGESFPYADSATRRVIAHGRAEAFIPGEEAPDHVPDELERHCPRCPTCLVPLAEGGESIGSLAVVRRPERRPFDEDEIARAQTFGRLAALAFRRVRLLEDSERRRKELQRALESRARLVRGFSHDVKNPLSVAEGHLGLLEDGLLDDLAPRQRDGVERARRSIRSAVRLIDSLVELARAESGRMRVEYVMVDARSVVRQVVEEYRPGAEAKGLALHFESPDELPALRSDPDRIDQVLGNLVSNAVKYTDEGEVRLRIDERTGPPAPGPGRWIAIDVADTGRGIPEDKRDAVFGEFMRLEPGKGRGAGLGLAISRRLARLLGGDITLESELGRGSTFTLWLPLEPRREGPAAGSAATDGGAGATPPGDPSGPRGWPDIFLNQLEEYAVFMVDPAGRIHGWNRGAERATGYAADRAIGRPFAMLYPREEAESGKPEREMRLALERGRYQEERWRLKADGSPFLAREILVPLYDHAGEHIGFGKVLQDLTRRRRAEAALRESERRFRATFEQAAVGIAHVAPDGHWIRVNRPLAEIVGYPRAELEGRTFQEVAHPDDLEANLVLARRMLAGEMDRSTMEKRYIRKDGSVVWTDLTVSLVRDDDGRPDYFISVIEDISGRKRTEADLVRAKEEAERASRAKSDFLAVMSHELRTPLTAVVGYAEVLEAEVDGPITPGQRKQLERIKASARHLVDLIEEILSFSRMESGREEVRPTTVDIAALARETADVVEPTMRESGLRFHVEVPDSPVPVETDPPKVRRILLDLLANAAKFTPEGEVALTMDATERRVVFRVRDTGIGIAPEDLEKVFEPFWQAAAALTREVGGTGLGLTVARRLARMLGGDVTIESDVGKGSTFTVELPRASEAGP